MHRSHCIWFMNKYSVARAVRPENTPGESDVIELKLVSLGEVGVM